MSLDDLIRERLATLVEPVDGEAVVRAVEARPKPGGRHRFRRTMLGVAAAAVLAVCAYGVVSIRGEQTHRLQSGPGTTTVAPTTTTPRMPFLDLGGGDVGLAAGSIVAVTGQAQLDELRAVNATTGAFDGPLLSLDYERQMLIAVTIFGGPCSFQPDHLEAEGGTVTAVAAMDTNSYCSNPPATLGPQATQTRFAALNWSDTGSSFEFRLPADPVGRYPEQTISVTKPPPSTASPLTIGAPSAVPAGGQDPSRPPASQSPARLKGRIEIPNREIWTSWMSKGVLVVTNRTGRSVHTECHVSFALAFVGGPSHTWPGPCVRPGSTFPPGESRWPVALDPTEGTCQPPAGEPSCLSGGALPPGEYQVGLVYEAGDLIVDTPNVPVTLVIM